MKKNIEKLFHESPYLSTKHSSYFHSYKKKISRFIDKEIILDEGDIIKIYNHEINCTNNEIYFMKSTKIGNRAMEIYDVKIRIIPALVAISG